MQVSARSIRRERPESLVHRLVARLRRQALWDSLLLFVPPAATLIWLFAVLFRTAWLSPNALAVAAVIVIALSALVVALRRRPLVPSVRSAARLVDQRAGAKDHFLTLATVEAAKQPEALIARLRGQAEQFRDRVELRRDFPYRPKSSAYWSLGGSLVAAMLIYFLLPMGFPARDLAAPERLREAAKELAVKPELRALAKELEAIAARVEDPNVSAEEKQALMQRLEQKIQEEQKKTQSEENRDLLAQAASAVGGQEQQQASGGQQEKQQKGAGGIQTNAPQQGQGENQQSQGGSGDGKGESTAQLNQGTDQGKSSQTKPNQPGQDKNSSGQAKNDQNQPDPDQRDPSKSNPGKTQGGVKEGGGKQQASAEPPPQGGTPAERFYKPGEGKDGIKGAGYVTVQLPEEVVADAKGESRASKDQKNARTRTPVPVSNVPLPAHVPNAPAEKQPLPIEYRDIIR